MSLPPSAAKEKLLEFYGDHMITGVTWSGDDRHVVASSYDGRLVWLDAGLSRVSAKTHQGDHTAQLTGDYVYEGSKAKSRIYVDRKNYGAPYGQARELTETQKVALFDMSRYNTSLNTLWEKERSSHMDLLEQVNSAREVAQEFKRFVDGELEWPNDEDVGKMVEYVRDVLDFVIAKVEDPEQNSDLQPPAVPTKKLTPGEKQHADKMEAIIQRVNDIYRTYRDDYDYVADMRNVATQKKEEFDEIIHRPRRYAEDERSMLKLISEVEGIYNRLEDQIQRDEGHVDEYGIPIKEEPTASSLVCAGCNKPLLFTGVPMESDSVEKVAAKNLCKKILKQGNSSKIISDKFHDRAIEIYNNLKVSETDYDTYRLIGDAKNLYDEFQTYMKAEYEPELQKIKNEINQVCRRAYDSEKSKLMEKLFPLDPIRNACKDCQYIEEAHQLLKDVQDMEEKRYHYMWGYSIKDGASFEIRKQGIMSLRIEARKIMKDIESAAGRKKGKQEKYVNPARQLLAEAEDMTAGFYERIQEAVEKMRAILESVSSDSSFSEGVERSSALLEHVLSRRPTYGVEEQDEDGLQWYEMRVLCEGNLYLEERWTEEDALRQTGSGIIRPGNEMQIENGLGLVSTGGEVTVDYKRRGYSSDLEFAEKGIPAMIDQLKKFVKECQKDEGAEAKTSDRRSRIPECASDDQRKALTTHYVLDPSITPSGPYREALSIKERVDQTIQLMNTAKTEFVNFFDIVQKKEYKKDSKSKLEKTKDKAELVELGVKVRTEYSSAQGRMEEMEKQVAVVTRKRSEREQLRRDLFAADAFYYQKYMIARAINSDIAKGPRKGERPDPDSGYIGFEQKYESKFHAIVAMFDEIKEKHEKGDDDEISIQFEPSAQDLKNDPNLTKYVKWTKYMASTLETMYDKIYKELIADSSKRKQEREQIKKNIEKTLDWMRLIRRRAGTKGVEQTSDLDASIAKVQGKVNTMQDYAYADNIKLLRPIAEEVESIRSDVYEWATENGIDTKEEKDDKNQFSVENKGYSYGDNQHDNSKKGNNTKHADKTQGVSILEMPADSYTTTWEITFLFSASIRDAVSLKKLRTSSLTDTAAVFTGADGLSSTSLSSSGGRAGNLPLKEYVFHFCTSTKDGIYKAYTTSRGDSQLTYHHLLVKSPEKIQLMQVNGVGQETMYGKAYQDLLLQHRPRAEGDVDLLDMEYDEVPSIGDGEIYHHHGWNNVFHYGNPCLRTKDSTVPLEHVRRSHRGNRFAASGWSGRCIVYAPCNKSRMGELDPAEKGEDMLLLRGHAGAVTHACWSPDDQFIATCSVDHTVRLWNSKTGKQLLILLGHSRFVRSVEWSPDGNFLASGGDDATVRVWFVGEWYQSGGQDPGSITCVRFEKAGLHSQPESLLSLAWSPDSKKLAMGWHGHEAEVRKLVTRDNDKRYWEQAYVLRETLRKVKKRVKGKNGQMYSIDVYVPYYSCRHVHAMQFSPDGKWLATAGGERSLQIWDASSGNHKWAAMDVTTQQIWGLEWNSAGTRVAMGSESGEVLVVGLDNYWLSKELDLGKKKDGGGLPSEEARRRYLTWNGDIKEPSHPNQWSRGQQHAWEEHD